MASPFGGQFGLVVEHGPGTLLVAESEQGVDEEVVPGHHPRLVDEVVHAEVEEGSQRGDGGLVVGGAGGQLGLGVGGVAPRRDAAALADQVLCGTDVGLRPLSFAAACGDEDGGAHDERLRADGWRAQELFHHAVRQGGLALVPARAHHVGIFDPAEELVGQRGLAGPHGSGDQHQLRLASPYPVQSRMEHVELALPADEVRI